MQQKYGILFFVLLFVPAFVQAQFQFGVRSDNFAGLMSANLNPALTAFSPYRWDIQVAGVAHFTENNFGYLADVSVPELLKSADDFDFGPNLRKENLTSEGIVLDFYEDGRERYLYSTSTISYPSVSYALRENHRLGLILQSRAVIGFDNVSENFSYYTFNTRASYDTFPVPPAFGGITSWTEMGLHYSYKRELKSGVLAVGLTAKYLTGHEAGYFYTDKRFRMARLPQNGLTGTPVDLNFAYTHTLFSDSSTPTPFSNGRGLGFDLGLAWKIDGGAEGYVWKLGISLLDMGSIRFDRAAFRHEIKLDAPGTLNGNSYRFYDQLSESQAVIDTFTTQLMGSPNASLIENAFTQGLPSRLSLQADRRISSKIYLGAILVQPLRLVKTAISGGSLLMVAPRYESRLISVSVPLSVYQWDKTHLGISLRLGPLYLGSDNLLSFSKQPKLSGADFFAGLRLSPWLYGRDKGLLSGSIRGNSACPKF